MDKELKVIIKAEADKVKKATEDAKKQVKSFADRVKDAGKDVDDKFKAMGESISNGIATAAKGVGVALAGVATALVGTSAATEEYRKNQGLLTAAFETAGSSAESAKQTYNDLYRVLGDNGQATEAAQHLAKLTTGQEELSQWTNICQGVYATFGASLPIESLTEASNETAKVGTVTGALADALNWAGISEDAFNEKLAACNSEAEREKLIRETLNKTYSAAAASYEKNNAEVLAQNDAQAKLQENLAKIGQTIAPVISQFTSFAADALAKVAPYVKDLGEKLIPVLKDVLAGVGDAVKKTMGFIKENWGLVLTIAGVIGGITAAIGIYNTVAAIKAAMDAAQVTTVWGLVAAHIAQAAAAMAALAPYLLIVAAIAAVIAIIVLCIKYWDEIVAAVKIAVEAISNAISAAWDWVVELFSTIGGWIYDNVIAPVLDFFKGLWDGIVAAYHTVIDPWIEIFIRIAAIVDEKIIQPVKNFFSKLWEDIKGIFSAVGSWFNTNIVQPVVSVFTKIWDAIKKGASAAWEGIKKPFSAVANWFKDIFSKAWQAVKNVFSAGGKIFDGIKDGIVSVFKTVVNAIIKGINKVISVPFNAINAVLKKIKGIEIVGIKPFDWIKTFTVPQIPELEKGGILKKGQVGLLEGNGTEAVVPLEKNTEWITRVAEMLGGKLSGALGGSSQPIILTIDGKVLGEATVSSINSITRQTGSLPLVLG